MHIKIKMPPVLETPLACALAGSLLLHTVLVFLYGTILIPEKSDSPPPKKFKIEMVKRKPEPVKKVEVIKKPIKKPTEITPIPVKKPRAPITAKSLRQKEVKVMPVTDFIPEKPKPAPQKVQSSISTKKIKQKDIDIKPVSHLVAEKIKLNPPRITTKPLQIAKASVHTEPDRVAARKMKPVKIRNHNTAKPQGLQSAKAASVVPTQILRPLKNVPSLQQSAGTATRIHKHSAKSVDLPSKPKMETALAVLTNDSMSRKSIRQTSKAIATEPSTAPTVLAHNKISLEKKVPVSLQTNKPSGPTVFPAARKRVATEKTAFLPKRVRKAAVFKEAPSRSESIQSIQPKKFYRPENTSFDTASPMSAVKARPIDTLPSSRAALSVHPMKRPSSAYSKREIVQKGVRVAAAVFPAPRAVPIVVDEGILEGYLGQLQSLIASAKKYPESARQSGHEGKVTVQFKVLKNGDVKDIKLVTKSNHPDLDREAVAAVKRAAPLKGLPDEIGKPFLDIMLPFKFQLNE